MKNQEIHNIKILLDEAYTGPAWHGPSVKEVLKNISHTESLSAINDSNNIAEIVFHMIAWRIFLINKLKGQDDYEVSEVANFQKFDTITEQEWATLKSNLEHSQNELQELLSKSDDEILYKKVGLRKHNFHILMNGVIQHDLYHLGQIVLIKKHS